jgi:hypothetical protein
MEIDRPAELRINAWDGSQSPTLEFPDRTPDDASKEVLRLRTLAPVRVVDMRDWRSRDVGWGLVLRDNDGIAAKDKAVGADAPEPLRRLLAARAHAPAETAPILRYRANKPPGLLYRYYKDGECEPLSTAAPDRGVRAGQIPQYLLLYGSPAEIPWAVQYGLNLSAFVGRLDLTVEEGLGNYVDALIDDWKTAGTSDLARPVVWSTNWGVPDITFLMARIVGAELEARFAQDDETQGRTWITGASATCAALGNALQEHRPGFICTTSHGMTGPLKDSAATIANLGSPVDALRQCLAAEALDAWSPGGAIWYSRACCSAGSDGVTRYLELFTPNEKNAALTRGVATVAGARVAPLPRKMLGRPNPLRAFIGHVEPTFDWTLRDPLTKQELAHTIVRCLYDSLYAAVRPPPTIGWALADIFKESGSFFGLFQPPPDADDRNTLQVYRRLAAMDRQNLVVLGDPTVSLRRMPDETV